MWRNATEKVRSKEKRIEHRKAFFEQKKREDGLQYHTLRSYEAKFVLK